MQDDLMTVLSPQCYFLYIVLRWHIYIEQGPRSLPVHHFCSQISRMKTCIIGVRSIKFHILAYTWKSQSVIHHYMTMLNRGNQPTLRANKKIFVFSWRIYVTHFHYNDFIMRAMASQITGVSIVYQGKHQSSASLTFMMWIHRWPAISPRKGPVKRKMFLLDDVIVLARFPDTLEILLPGARAANQDGLFPCLSPPHTT